MNKKLGFLIIAMLFLISILCVMPKVEKVSAPNGVITIKADGSIDPPTAPIDNANNVTYTFLGNINASIVVERSNITIDGAGYVLNGIDVVEWTGITVEYTPINVTIQNVKIIGFGAAIGIISTDNITVIENTIAGNTYGIWLAETMYSEISGNTIANSSEGGIYSNTAFNCTFSDNNITDTVGNGIHFSHSSNNIIFGNNIKANNRSIWIEFSSNNKFYHNYFINNTNQIPHVESGDENIWDDGYPFGGNYWSDFPTRYPGVGNDYSGPGQDIPGSDEIWDEPYNIDQLNIDHYPLIPEFPALAFVPLSMITILLAVALNKTHTKQPATKQKC